MRRAAAAPRDKIQLALRPRLARLERANIRVYFDSSGAVATSNGSSKHQNLNLFHKFHRLRVILLKK